MTSACSPVAALPVDEEPMPAEREHGGGVDRAVAQYGIAREHWIDLSTGINPASYPLPALPLALWHALPDATLVDRLRTAAASSYGAPDAALVVPGPGSQALIQWLPRIEKASRVAVLGPTYNEHAPAWAAAGHSIVELESIKAIPDDAAIVVIVNPNNPDGRLFEPLRLLELTPRRLLVVDEAFADVAPEASLARWAGCPNLVVLRSLGKFFGLAGLRLGFALTEQRRARTLEAALGPWPVSGPAAAIGAAALADQRWITATRAALAAAAGRLDALAAANGLTVVGGTALFRLMAHPDAQALFERLARAGILARRFAARPDWLRLGLPDSEDAWARLAAAFAGWQEDCRQDQPRSAG